ncbi:MAG: divergent polysaccharide deacetylase family protein [Candidatus Tumulicola sp.]
MPKNRNRNRRRRGSTTVAFAALALLAAVAAWWLLVPRNAHRAARHVVAVQPAESTAPAETPLPAVTPPSAEPPATPEPSPAQSPTPLPLAPASPRTAPGLNSGAPKLALIVDDCGQWIDTERAFVALGVPLTLSVLPDVHYTATIAKEAADAGKGVMLHLPMETLSGLNPGPGKVTTEMTDAQITAQVEDDLSQVPLAQGVNNHEGSKGSADPRLMRDVMDVLVKRGNLFFIDSRTSAASVGERTAEAAGVPTAGRDVFLDNEASVAYTEAQLREAAAIAKRTGSAIAIGHPRPTTLEAVRALIPELQAAGIVFVLAQDLVSAAGR